MKHTQHALSINNGRISNRGSHKTRDDECVYQTKKKTEPAKRKRKGCARTTTTKKRSIVNNNKRKTVRQKKQRSGRLALKKISSKGLKQVCISTCIFTHINTYIYT